MKFFPKRYPDPAKFTIAWKPITGVAINFPLKSPFVAQLEGSANFNESGYQGWNATVRLTTQKQIGVTGSPFEQDTTAAKLIDQWKKTPGGAPLFAPEALAQAVSDRYDSKKPDEHGIWAVDLGLSYNNQFPSPTSPPLGVIGDRVRFTSQPDLPGFTAILSVNIPVPELLFSRLY